MSDNMDTLSTMLLRSDLDGRDIITQEPSPKDPLVVLSLASDPDNVTVVPRPSSKEDAEFMVAEIFDLHPSAPMILKRRTITSDGRTVWASIPADHWKRVIREGDELRLFTNAGETKPRWDRVPATIIFGAWKRVMLLSDTYEATKEDIFNKIKNVKPKNITTSADIKLRLIIGDLDSDDEYDTAILHQRSDTDDEWRDLVRLMKTEHKELRLEITTKKQNSRGPRT